MPLVEISLFPGRTAEQKREVSRRVSDVLVSAAGAVPETVYVIFREVPSQDGAAFDAYILNPGGLWAFGEPTRLALAECDRPFVEVHFANIFATGHESTFTKSATGTVMGFRQHGYLGALVALVAALRSGAAESAPTGAAGNPANS